MKVVTLTEKAAIRVKKIMKENEETNAFLRIGVQGGGCNGLTYAMGFDYEVDEGDLQSEQFGIKVLVDENSAPLLQGTVIDYKETEMGGGFIIDNPNAIASCGCGSSFRTADEAGTPEEC